MNSNTFENWKGIINILMGPLFSDLAIADYTRNSVGILFNDSLLSKSPFVVLINVAILKPAVAIFTPKSHACKKRFPPIGTLFPPFANES